MKITIGGQDYSSALDASHPLTIERKLNEPSVCQLWLSLSANDDLASPIRNQSLVVSGDDGTCYFTGYIAVSPLPEYAGLAMAGPRYRIAIEAVSDELLLDQVEIAPGKGASGMQAGPLLASLVTKTGATSLSTQSLTLNVPVSEFVPRPGARWSKSAGEVANQARATYRVLNDDLTLASVPALVHPLNETDGTLTLANLSLTSGAKRALANDVTVCGEHEPAAYVTEYFLGDGVTAQFFLGALPYSPPASQSAVIRELFNQAAIDLRVWSNPGSGGYFTLGASGLTMAGGNGIDGETALTWIDPIEMGGTLLLEANGVTLAPFSTGIVAGFFVGLERQASCTAGFKVTAQQGSGAVALQPIVQGTPAGTSYPVNPANQYALRIRVHCPECERQFATYRGFGDNGPLTTGGQSVAAPGKLLFEIQEFVNGVAGMPVTLYDGSVASLPAACMVAAASSINLQGSMRALNLTKLCPGWVVTTPVNGSPVTRRVGTTAEAAECLVENTGRLVFYTGFTPAVGARIAISYRAVNRAVGRAVNTASQQSLAASGLPPAATWIGTVSNPLARSSQDCRNAALVMGQAAASVSALWRGTYRATRGSFAADVWPGDALLLNAPSTNLNAQVVIRSVTVSYRASCPDLIEYAITFANDWAEDLGITTSTAVPADPWLHAPIAPTFCANLSGLAVAAINGSNVTISTGATAPTGGGFEVRRRDHVFMPGEDPDLVMRGSQPTMTFTRVSASDRYYVRMFDGATPPNYSEFSAALFFNLPLNSGE